ncbi:hypothetical protein [Anabaena sp. UHCC 0399]|uniref:hypothetical protein n=1 Tax=Anabaena sp. UHCC 0399 TaxID=3110238 RepID=UPI002B1F7653|nr:hypothetical protein [Anabaena sp. UHCC 0399]MEA5565771.1 hypothetical protein [Anabaena sp. UHCC 0399]
MNPFVGYKQVPLQVTELIELITKMAELSPKNSNFFLRWSHQVSGIIDKSPTANEFPMLEGQMFNYDYELRWKQKHKNTYEVLMLSILGEYSGFELLGENWLTKDHDAHLYLPTETRFPKGFSPTDVDVKQRYFIDEKTASVHFVALTTKKST